MESGQSRRKHIHANSLFRWRYTRTIPIVHSVKWGNAQLIIVMWIGLQAKAKCGWLAYFLLILLSV